MPRETPSLPHTLDSSFSLKDLSLSIQYTLLFHHWAPYLYLTSHLKSKKKTLKELIKNAYKVHALHISRETPYLTPQTPPSPLRICLCLYNIPYCSIIELPIYILPHIWILTNPFGRIAGLILPQSTMPPKTRSTPAPALDGNTPVMQRQSASASSADENAKSILAESEPLSEF